MQVTYGKLSFFYLLTYI